jgi:hypothetical protein
MVAQYQDIRANEMNMLKTIRLEISLYSEGYGILSTCYSIFCSGKRKNENDLNYFGLSNAEL